MSRSGYTDDIEDQWGLIRWRGAVKSALRGSRGQALLREMADAMDALPRKELGANDLIDHNGCVCALGAVAWARGMNLTEIDPHDSQSISSEFDVAEAMAREIVYENDECFWGCETPEHRFHRMRRWVAGWIKADTVHESTA